MTRFLLFSFLLHGLAIAETNTSAPWEVTGGTASFIATTNLSAVTVHGKTDQLTARVRMHQREQQLLIDSIQASVNARSLVTGMGVRDQHLREKVLTAKDGSLPDLRFEAENTQCPAPATASRHLATSPALSSCAAKGSRSA